MSLLFVDSFDDGMWNLGKWDVSSGSLALVAGRTGNGLQTFNPSYVEKNIATSSTVIVGQARKTDRISGQNSDIVGFYTTSGTVKELNVRIETNGYLAIYRNNTQIAVTGSAVIGADVFNYIEFKGVLANSGGTAEIILNGVSVLSFTGDTLDGTVTDIDKIRVGSGATIDVIDDLYICDGTGSTNNTFLGDVTVEKLTPNGNGNSSVLVGSDGNSTDNYLLVDETTPSTADYVGSATEGDKDTYAYSNIAGAPASVLGVAVNSYQAKSDSGTKFARPVVRSGTTDYVGTSVSLSTSYVAGQQLWETDPDTAVAWTESGVNAIEAGFEVRDS